jgi:hypothetical protein
MNRQKSDLYRYPAIYIQGKLTNNHFYRHDNMLLPKEIHYQFGLTGVCGPKKMNMQFLAWCTEQKKSV